MEDKAGDLTFLWSAPCPKLILMWSPFLSSWACQEETHMSQSTISPPSPHRPMIGRLKKNDAAGARHPHVLTCIFMKLRPAGPNRSVSRSWVDARRANISGKLWCLP
jgi:hypothetical protein